HLLDEIRGFKNLNEGWNSHKAARISEMAIKSALEVVHALDRRHVPLPSAAPTPLGRVMLMWEIGDKELQLLIDAHEFDYSVGSTRDPNLIEEGSFSSIDAVERKFIDRFLVLPA